MRVTDRRTDRILITIPRLHYMQRGKNGTQKQKFPLASLFLEHSVVQQTRRAKKPKSSPSHALYVPDAVTSIQVTVNDVAIQAHQKTWQNVYKSAD